MRVITTAILGVCLCSTTLLSNSADDIFQQKCSTCHTKTAPQNRADALAPPFSGVIKHVKMRYPDRDRAVAFIVDYVMHPSEEKSVCNKSKLKRFGIMPSQKGAITQHELEIVAKWMFDNFANTNKIAKKGIKMKKPFLIESTQLPHYIGLLKDRWDDKKLDLNDKQKLALKHLEKDTVTSVKQISKKIESLEIKIAHLSNNMTPYQEIMPTVKEVGQLKIEATQIHLRCLEKTRHILTKEQIALLTTKK